MNPSQFHPPRFLTTRWSLVNAAREKDEVKREALAKLFEQYWQPIYVFIRHQGHGHDDAGDLTQSFLLELLEKDAFVKANPDRGRFRSFLLGCLKYFLSHEREKAKAIKRGGAMQTIPLEPEQCEMLFEVSKKGVSPELIFEKAWLNLVLNQSMEQLLQAATSQDEMIKIRRLLPYIIPSMATTEVDPNANKSTAFRQQVSRLRKQFQRVLRDNITQTLNDPAELEDEINYLFEVASK